MTTVSHEDAGWAANEIFALRDALEGMVLHYGLRSKREDGREAVYAGGCRALERAFKALGWNPAGQIIE